MEIVEGSGNVFADLGLPDPEERLASRIQDAIEVRGWSPERAAEALALGEAGVSQLARGVLNGFSVALLTEFLVVVEGA